MPGGTQVLEITDQSLDPVLASDGRPMLLDITASWCGPCQLMAPELAKFAATHRNRVRVGLVDSDVCSEIRERFGTNSLPTLILLGAEGTEVYLARAMTYAELEAVMLPYILKAPPGVPRAPSIPSYRAGRHVIVSADDRLTVRFVPVGKLHFPFPIAPGAHEVPADSHVRVGLVMQPGSAVESFALLRGWEPSVDQLTIAGTFESGDLASLARYTTLSDLTLPAGSALNDTDLAAIGGLTPLKHLSLPGDVAGSALDDIRNAPPQCIVNGRWVSRRSLSEVGPIPNCTLFHRPDARKSSATSAFRIRRRH